MNELFEQWSADPWGRLVVHVLAAGGIGTCLKFFLVMSRLTGAFVLAPWGTKCLIPISVRMLFSILLSLVILPTVPDSSGIEDPFHQTSVTGAFPETVTSLAGLILIELALGALLGAGVLAVLQGFRLAGEWLERHSGLNQGSLLNPNWSAGESTYGQLIPFLGTAVFVCMEPIGGQWFILQSLASSFQEIPLGSATISVATIGLLNSLVQQSLLLGIRIAIPLVITMLAIDVTLAFGCRNGHPAIGNAFVLVKSGLALFIVALTLTTIPDVIATTITSLLS